MKIDREELAWTAGFFDGEGHIGFHKSGDHRKVLTISVNQSGSPETLHRMLRAWPVKGAVNGPYPRKDRPHAKPFWALRVVGAEKIQAVIAMMWPFLSGPKREQAAAAITAARETHSKRIWNGCELWTPDAVSLFRSAYGLIQTPVLAQLLNRTSGALHRYANAKGIRHADWSARHESAWKGIA